MIRDRMSPARSALSTAALRHSILIQYLILLVAAVLTLSFFFFLSFPILQLFAHKLHFFTGIPRSKVFKIVHFLFHVVCLFLGRFLLLFWVLGMTTMTVLCALSTLTPNHCSSNMISMSYVTIQNWKCWTVAMFGMKHLRFLMSGSQPPKSHATPRSGPSRRALIDHSPEAQSADRASNMRLGSIRSHGQENAKRGLSPVKSTESRLDPELLKG